MEQEIFVDMEFVIVDLEAEVSLAHRPAMKLAQREDKGLIMVRPAMKLAQWEEEGLTMERACVILAELLRCPVRDVRVVAGVGRVYMVEYEPLGKVDPDILLLDWPSARPIQSAILALQEVRALKVREWGEWWAMIDGYIQDLARLMVGARISGEERAFVMWWARRVRDSGAALTSRKVDSYANYWG